MNRRTFLAIATSGDFFIKSALARSGPTPPSYPILPGLTPAQRDRALLLHQESVVIDCHDHMWRPENFVEMKNGGVTAKI